VEIIWRGSNNITLKPQGSPHVAEQPQPRVERPKKVTSATPTDKEAPQPMDTGAAAATMSKSQLKKQQRDALRRQQFHARLAQERWLRLVGTYCRSWRWQMCQDVWTTWMRARKLRTLLWREWTRPQFEATPAIPETADFDRQLGSKDLGLRSHRDEFMLKRVRARCARLADSTPWVFILRRVRFWLGGRWDDGEGCVNEFDRKEHMMFLQQMKTLPIGNGMVSMDQFRAFPAEARAVLASSCDEAIMFSPRKAYVDTNIRAARDKLRESLQDQANNNAVGTSAAGPKDGARSRDEAGGLATPPSARANRKKRPSRR